MSLNLRGIHFTYSQNTIEILSRWLDPNFKIPQIAYAAFGAGPRICIGMRLGIMEEKLALAHLLRRFTIEKATDDKELRMHGALILTPLDVPVRIVPRT